MVVVRGWGAICTSAALEAFAAIVRTNKTIPAQPRRTPKFGVVLKCLAEATSWRPQDVAFHSNVT